MENKKQKKEMVNENIIIKNRSFSNLQFEFEDSDENEKMKKFDIKEDEISDAGHYINFSNKSIFQKSEIKFNNFLNEKLDTQTINKKPKIYTPLIGRTTYTSFIWDKPKNKLFIFGENDFLQLGNENWSHEQNISTPTNDIITTNKLNFSKIKKFCFGRMHCLLLFENNDLYSWGWDGDGECGINSHSLEIQTPKKIEFFRNKKIKDIRCSHSSSYVQLEDNKFYSFGDNAYKQLGIEKKTSDKYGIYNIKFFNDKLIKDVFISNDGNHCFFLDDKNVVYGFGGNVDNKMGIFENENDVIVSTKIKTLENIKVKKIFTGVHHTFVLDENESLYTFGSNFRGACGLGHDNKIKKIEEVEFFKKNGEKIKLISIGSFFTIFLTKSSKVFCCGSNCYGQLGVGNNLIVDGIKENEFFKDKNIMDIKSCFSSSLAISKDGKIYSWGRVRGEQEDHNIPIQIYKI